MSDCKPIIPAYCAIDAEIRVIFPLLKRKDGKPRKKQPYVEVGLNGRWLCIPRGEIAAVPIWVQTVVETSSSPNFECFVSSIKPERVKG